MRQKDKNALKRAALKRAAEYLKKASAAFPDRAKANHWVDKARKASMKARLRLPLELKRTFCKHCYAFLKPGTNSRIRINQHRVIIYCLECKKFTRIPVKIKTTTKKE